MISITESSDSMSRIGLARLAKTPVRVLRSGSAEMSIIGRFIMVPQIGRTGTMSFGHRWFGPKLAAR
jgi:hypothetical protein